MPATAGQRALSAGLQALQRVYPSTWGFGDATWEASAALLRPGDPRELDEPVRQMLMTVETSALPDPRPERGDYLTRGSASHRILQVDHDEDTAISTFLLSAGNGAGAGDS